MRCAMFLVASFAFSWPAAAAADEVEDFKLAVMLRQYERERAEGLVNLNQRYLEIFGARKAEADRDSDEGAVAECDRKIARLAAEVAALKKGMVAMPEGADQVVEIVGKWTFVHRGKKRAFEFEAGGEFRGQFPSSGKRFSGTWKRVGTDVALRRPKDDKDWATITLGPDGKVIFVDVGGFSMVGTPGKR